MQKDIPFLMINETDASLPFYLQIYEKIRNEILSGEFKAGMRLPSTRALAKQLGVSRMTVVNAYDQLLAEGYLEGKKGAGTFIAAKIPEYFFKAKDVEKAKDLSQSRGRKINFSPYGAKLHENSRRILGAYQKNKFSAFEIGVPALDKFPFEIWQKIAARVHNGVRKEFYGYTDFAGYEPLQTAIAEHLRSVRNVKCTPAQIIITNGAQQTFDLIAKVFLERGDKVLIEDPCYFGVKLALGVYGVEMIPARVDAEGIEIENIERQPSVSFVYVTPSHQFPLGVTMSLARRLALLEKAAERDLWIIEDDYDSEFRYGGKPVTSLQGLDKNGRVLYVGTFSKTVFPGLRLGCLVVPEDLIGVFSAARAVSDGHSSVVDQAILAEFIAEGHFAKHLHRMRKIYQKRQEILVSEVKRELAGLMEIEPNNAGMHLIGWLPEKADDISISKKLAAVGIRNMPVSLYAMMKMPRGGIMLGYTATDEEQIKNGVETIKKVLMSELGTLKAAK